MQTCDNVIQNRCRMQVRCVAAELCGNVAK